MLVALSIVVTGFATAGGLALHLGVGYHSSFINELPKDFVSDITVMPFGVGGYFGLGYAFDTEETWSIGGEFAPSWDFGLQDNLLLTSFNHNLRGFVKFKPFDFLTVTGLFGYAGDILFSSAFAEAIHDYEEELELQNIFDYELDYEEIFENIIQFNANAVLGLRVTVFPIYIEYDMVTPWDFSTIYKHEVGVGFAIIK